MLLLITVHIHVKLEIQKKIICLIQNFPYYCARNMFFWIELNAPFPGKS